MKKTDKTLLEAMEFESIVSKSTGTRSGVNNRLYAIEGRPGVFRRVGRTTSGTVPPEKNAIAYFGGQIIELAYAKDVVDELLIAVSSESTVAVAIGAAAESGESSPDETIAARMQVAIRHLDSTDSIEFSTPVGVFDVPADSPLARRICDPGHEFSYADLDDAEPYRRGEKPCVPKNETAGSPATPTAAPTTRRKANP